MPVIKISQGGTWYEIPIIDETLYLLLDGTRAMTGTLDMGSQSIQNIIGITMTGRLNADGSAGSSTQVLHGGSPASYATVNADNVDYDDDNSETAETKVNGALDELYQHIATTQLDFYVNNQTINAGSVVRGWLQTTDNDVGMPLESGQSFKVLAIYGRMKTGATAGTYDFSWGVRRIEAVNASSPTTDSFILTASSSSTNTWVQASDITGTIENPIATITGGSGYRLLPCFRNDATSPGATASDKHMVMVVGVVV